MDKEELKKRYIEMQLFDNELKQLRENLEGIESQLMEIRHIQESIQGIRQYKDGTTMLVPIANGIFIKAKLVKEDKLKINIGQNSVTEYSFDETTKLLTRQKNNIEELQKRLVTDFESLSGQMRRMEEDLIKASQAQNQ